MREAMAGGADAQRLHGLRGEQKALMAESHLCLKRGRKHN